MSQAERLSSKEIPSDLLSALKDTSERMLRLCDILEKNKSLLSCSEAARFLGVSPATVTRYIRCGKIRKVCIDGRTGILVSDLSGISKYGRI